MSTAKRTDTRLEPFDALPDDARVWVFGFDKPLTEESQRLIGDRMRSFVTTWNSHGSPVHGAFTIAEDRFVVVAGKAGDGISGCSIDSSVENFKFFRDAHGLDGLNRSLVFYRDEKGGVRSCDRSEFEALVRDGVVTADTSVFDPTIETLADLRAGRFEKPFESSWHAQAFGPVE